MIEPEDIQLNPEHKKLILAGFQEVVTYLQAGAKNAAKIEDPMMFLAEVRTKVRAAQGMLDGVQEKTYVARDDLDEQEEAAEGTDPGMGKPMYGSIQMY